MTELQNSSGPTVSVVGGSTSDFPLLRQATEILDQLAIDNELRVVSAHRTPDWLYEYAETAENRGIKVIIAGAGGAAHLPGMLASYTYLPVIGVPVKGSSTDGMDSLYSIVQMPKGVPVATVGINNATNAALLAIRIIASFDEETQQKLEDFREKQKRESRLKTSNLV